MFLLSPFFACSLVGQSGVESREMLEAEPGNRLPWDEAVKGLCGKKEAASVRLLLAGSRFMYVFRRE